LKRPFERSWRFLAPSFDHLVGTREQGGRYDQAKYLGGLKVNNKLEAGRQHDWQVGGSPARENATDVDADLPKTDP
jgi:hypothetical protein